MAEPGGFYNAGNYPDPDQHLASIDSQLDRLVQVTERQAENLEVVGVGLTQLTQSVNTLSRLVKSVNGVCQTLKRSTELKEFAIQHKDQQSG